MRILLKVLKFAGLLFLLAMTALFIFYLIYNKPLPEGESGPQADSLAMTMLKSLNSDAYDNTRYLEWSFAGGSHRYKWDKKLGKVEVGWGANKVMLNLNDNSKSKVLNTASKITESTKNELVETALAFFNNDSFWLVAPFKVFDEGTERRQVVLEDGSKGLLVTYAEGGTTPGDSYLWKLLPSGFPESYQMWVKIIPIGGLEATWDEWKQFDNGLRLPTSHNLGPMTLEMGEVKAYN